MTKIPNKCKHSWEEVRDSLFWCEKCGSLRYLDYSYMSDRCSERIRTNEMYADVLRGVLRYG